MADLNDSQILCIALAKCGSRVARWVKTSAIDRLAVERNGVATVAEPMAQWRLSDKDLQIVQIRIQSRGSHSVESNKTSCQEKSAHVTIRKTYNDQISTSDETITRAGEIPI